MKSGGKHESRLSRDHNIWETQKNRHDGNGAKFFCLLLLHENWNKKERERERENLLIKCTSKHFPVFLGFSFFFPPKFCAGEGKAKGNRWQKEILNGCKNAGKLVGQGAAVGALHPWPVIMSHCVTSDKFSTCSALFPHLSNDQNSICLTSCLSASCNEVLC